MFTEWMKKLLGCSTSQTEEGQPSIEKVSSSLQDLFTSHAIAHHFPLTTSGSNSSPFPKHVTPSLSLCTMTWWFCIRFTSVWSTLSSTHPSRALPNISFTMRPLFSKREFIAVPKSHYCLVFLGLLDTSQILCHHIVYLSEVPSLDFKQALDLPITNSLGSASHIVGIKDRWLNAWAKECWILVFQNTCVFQWSPVKINPLVHVRK